MQLHKTESEISTKANRTVIFDEMRNVKDA
jgi:hypothetical protein